MRAAMKTAPSSRPAPSEPSLTLPRSFWKDFARKTWDREPTLYKGMFAQHFPTLAEVFEALVEANERMGRGEDMMRILRLYLEHTDAPNGVPYYSMLFPLRREHLPMREDGDARGYLERITRVFGGKRIGLVVNRTQCFHWGHWQQMRSFLAGFHQAVGVPLGGADSALFFGNYHYTPFGIHKDDLHIFYFVVEGKKRMTFWPYADLAGRDEVSKEPGALQRSGGIFLRDKEDEAQLLARATVLEGHAGDWMYWPQSYWHRAEPTDALSVSLSLGVGLRPPFFTQSGPLGGTWPESMRHAELPRAEGWRLPAPVRSGLRRASRPEARRVAERAQTEEWTRFLSAHTLEGAAPRAHETPLSREEWLVGFPQWPIVGVPLASEEVLLAANGHSKVLEAPPQVRRRLEKLVAALNSGKPQHIQALEEAFFTRLERRAFKPSAFLPLLEELLSWHAVRRA